MSQESIADIMSGGDEKEAAAQIHRLFSYLAQNPQQYPQIRQFLIENDQLDPEDLPEQMTPEQLAAAAQGMAPYAGEKGIGDMLASQGRNGDTMVAHVNPQEMQLLQSVGGSGTINPATGMPEFGLKKFFKKIVKPLVGAAIGFAIGGPLGAAAGLKTTAATAALGAIAGGSAGYMADQQSQAIKSAEAASAEQARMAQEFENRRIAEAQAEAERLRQAELRRQQNITAGQGEIASVFNQFNDDFFNKRAQSYLDYAMPTLDRQYQEQARELTAQLARSGNLNSSLRGDLMGRLQREYDTNKLSLTDTARGFANEARSSVANAKARLMESNASLADPGAVRTMAEAQASGLNTAPQFQSLSQMISDLSSSLQSAPNRRASAGGGGAGVSLFTGGAGRLVS